ncbi:hypothetical protein BJF78_19490 [Pseudonocardia sp. CNS-139]|nr:hypothetical protein BJF78_19490 [Pseudonocardia sp. CNS-139]
MPHVELAETGGPALARSQAAALATGLPYVLQTGWPAGLLVREALAAGTPAIEAEIGGHGMATRDGVETCRYSVLRVLAAAGVLAAGPAGAEAPDSRVVEPLDVRVDRSGLVLRHVDVGEPVRAGAPLATVVDLFGDVLQEITAPCDAVVGTVRTVGALTRGTGSSPCSSPPRSLPPLAPTRPSPRRTPDDRRRSNRPRHRRHERARQARRLRLPVGPRPAGADRPAADGRGRRGLRLRLRAHALAPHPADAAHARDHRNRYMLDAFPLMAMLADRTSRIRLGVNSALLPVHHPSSGPSTSRTWT